MNLSARLASLAQLGTFIRSSYGQAELEQIYRQAEYQNGWFSQAECRYAINQIATSFLSIEKLQAWVAAYPQLQKSTPAKNIGLILAGNIPAVGFHDILSCFVSGHKAIIKYSEKDKVLIPFLLKQLAIIEPASIPFFESVDKLKNFDAVIATGSDNAARYFDHYFGHCPNIIRKNRNSIAILTGQESDATLRKLSTDIFRYFGLGCRSVSKIMVPPHFSFENFMRVMDEFSEVMLHHKYKNNYDYNRSIYLLNNDKHWANNGLTLVEHPSLMSRISTVHYEFYNHQNDLLSKLETVKDNLQLVVSENALQGIVTTPFGASQNPQLTDYADRIDSLAFLATLATNHYTL